MARLIYGNTSGESNVHAYEEGKGWIRVVFMDGSVYLYTEASTGRSEIAYMKRLAGQGFGLNGYITRFIRKRYALKEK